MLRQIFIFLPLFVCAFWSFVLFVDLRQANKTKFILLFFMLISFLLFSGQFVYFTYQYNFYAFWDSINIFAILSVYPFFYLYILSLTDKKPPQRWKMIMLFVPALTMGFFSKAIYLLMPPSETYAYVHQVLYGESLNYEFSSLGKALIVSRIIYKTAFIFQICVIFYMGRKELLAFDKRATHYCTRTPQKILFPIKNLFYVFTFFTLLSISVNFIGKYSFIDSMPLLFGYSAALFVIFLLIGFFGTLPKFSVECCRKNIQENCKVDFVTLPLALDDKKTELSCNMENAPVLKRRLIDLLEKETIFRRADLRIQHISEMLNTNRTYISRIVNQEMNTTFSDLINTYRVEYAKTLLEDVAYNHATLLEIGEKAGFSSESSFYRAFKYCENITPSNYRKNYDSHRSLIPEKYAM